LLLLVSEDAERKRPLLGLARPLLPQSTAVTSASDMTASLPDLGDVGLVGTTRSDLDEASTDSRNGARAPVQVG
jgi:hypothetical protein